MVMIKVQTQIKAKAAKDWVVGEVLLGHYLGHKTVDVNSKPTLIHRIKNKQTGMEENLWGHKQLDSELSAVPTGHLTQITYIGKIKSKNGMGYHKFEVQYDDSEKIAV